MLHPSPVYGRDLYEALHADYPSRTTWGSLPLSMRLDYEKATQVLNIRLGLLESTSQLILIVHEDTVSPVSNVAELASYIDTRLVPHDRLEVHLIENGQAVGYGSYEKAENGHLTVYEERGKAHFVDDPMGLTLAERVATEPVSAYSRALASCAHAFRQESKKGKHA